jgi:NTP pyrophosphatase (non-canonical NTP hydrolase)
MDLTQLTARALQVHQRLNDTAAARGSRPWTREEVMQGFVVDVGELMQLSMAKAGARHVDDADRKLAHELADCLWSVLVLAQLHGIDLEEAFLATMHEIETKLGRSA